MKIGIMSDTHDNLPRIAAAVQMLSARGAEALIHAGDFVAPFAVKEILKFPGEVYGVFGNNDGEITGIKRIWKHVFFGPYLLELGGLRILVSHDPEDLERAPYGEIDVRVFGHNHKGEIRRGRPLVINPGECGAWLSGKSTCALLDTEGPAARLMEVE